MLCIIFPDKLKNWMHLLIYAELEQTAALKYLYGWLRHHPKYGSLAPPELSDSLYYADVSGIVYFYWLSSLLKDNLFVMRTGKSSRTMHIIIKRYRPMYLYQYLCQCIFWLDWKDWFSFLQVARLFNEAAEMSPDDADVHIVLGVLYNLSREYDKAIASFQRALKLKPQDYSLWNKLGATQANSVQSADAIMAYQQVRCFKLNPDMAVALM